jgi:hypothetical protein
MGDDEWIQNVKENLKGSEHLENITVDRRILLKWVLEE